MNDKDNLVLSRQRAVLLSNIKIRDQNKIIKDKAIMKQKERRTMKTTTSSLKRKSYDSDRVAEDEMIPERQKSQRKKTKSLKAKEDNEFESDEDYNPWQISICIYIYIIVHDNIIEQGI